ncbi:uncharacterized protein VP01_891g8, partial [Puccinia sorghi]
IAKRVEVYVGRILKIVHFWVADGPVQFILGKPFLTDPLQILKGRSFWSPLPTPSITKSKQSYLPILPPGIVWIMARTTTFPPSKGTYLRRTPTNLC